MRFKVTLKDPDTLHDAIVDAVNESMQDLVGLDDDERKVVAAQRRKAFTEIAARWFQYGEYLTVEIDTDARTATVCPA